MQPFVWPAPVDRARQQIAQPVAGLWRNDPASAIPATPAIPNDNKPGCSCGDRFALSFAARDSKLATFDRRVTVNEGIFFAHDPGRVFMNNGHVGAPQQFPRQIVATVNQGIHGVAKKIRSAIELGNWREEAVASRIQLRKRHFLELPNR
jgi:hypothetical protein